MTGLYANLLGKDTSTSTTISKAPVVFANATATSSASPSGGSGEEAAAAGAQKKINAAALRFQPTITKRPMPAAKKAMNFRPIAGFAAKEKKEGEEQPPPPAAAKPVPVVKTTLEDWVGDDEDVNGYYASAKKERQRGGRKKRKKNKATPPPPTNWDDVYDPLRPNSYEEYKEGDEKIREMEDWRERLYGKKRRMRYDSSSESEDDRRPAGHFAPPASYSFAPPPQFAPPSDNAPPPPPVEVPDDISGEDAFARRMRMSQQGAIGYAATAPQTATPTPPLPPPPPPPAEDSATISRAPVRYEQPPIPSEPTNTYSPSTPEPESSEPSSRPGQAGFAKRLMEKQGWKTGQGLGRDGTGITKAIQMVSSGKKGQHGRGKIVDKNKKRPDPAAQAASEVVLMHGIIDGKRAMEHGELLQKIGDEYKRYGRVVQIVIRWEEEEQEEEAEVEGGRARVYVLFADAGSALMAVNGLQRREIFEGNTTQAEFYPKEKFEAMEFD